MSSKQKDQKNKKNGVKAAIAATSSVFGGLATLGAVANQKGKNQKQKEMPKNDIHPPKPYGNWMPY